MKKGYILAIALLAGGLTVGCDALFDTPEKAAKEVMESIFAADIDRLKGRICSARSAELLKQSENQIKVFKEVMKLAKVDLSGVSFTADISGDTATVKTSGKMKIEVSFAGQTQTQEQSLDNTPPIKLIKEGGTWKICDTFGG